MERLVSLVARDVVPAFAFLDAHKGISFFDGEPVKHLWVFLSEVVDVVFIFIGGLFLLLFYFQDIVP